MSLLPSRDEMQTVTLSDASSALLYKMFSIRKRSFAHSLQEILYQISHDKVVRNILQDRITAQYIGDRICEVFKQIVVDDREKFIGELFQRVSQIQHFYMDKHTDKLKKIGKRILSVTKEQSDEEITHVRQIQLLTEQVKALQKEVASMDALKMETIANFESFDAQNSTQYGYTLDQKEFYHIYAYADVTSIKSSLKAIEAANISLSQMTTQIFDLVSKMHRAIQRQIMKKFTSTIKQIEQLKKINYELNSKTDQVVYKYENEVIPKIKKDFQHKLNSQIYTENELRHNIEKLNEDLQILESEKSDAISKNVILKTTISQLEDQNQELEEQNSELSANLKSTSAKLTKITTESAEKDSIIETLEKESRDKSKELSQTKHLLKSAEEAISEKTKEFEIADSKFKALKETLPPLEQENARLKRLLDEALAKNEALSKKERTLEAKVNETVPRLEIVSKQLEQIKQALAVMTEERDSNSRKLGLVEEDSREKASIIARLDAELDNTKTSLEQSISNQKDLENERKQLNDSIASLQDKLRKLQSQCDKLKQDVLNHEMTETRQAAKLKSLEENEKQTNEKLAQASKENAALESKVISLQGALDTAKAEHRDATEDRDKYKELLRKTKEDVENLSKENAILGQSEKEKKYQLEERSRASEQLSQQNEKLAKENHVLETANDELKGRVRDVEENLAKAKRESANLQGELNNAQEKNQRLTEASKESQKQLQALASTAKEMKAIVEEVNKIIPGKTIDEIVTSLKTMKEAADAMPAILKAASLENIHDVSKKIQEMKNSNELIQKIRKVFPGSGDILTQINRVREENDRLLAEQKRIHALLSAEPSVDISQMIQELFTKQTVVAEKLNSASEFVSRVMAIMTGSDEQTGRLVFPLTDVQMNNLVDLFAKIRKRSDSDHEEVEQILHHAQKYGYEGTDCIQAVNYIMGHSSVSAIEDVQVKRVKQQVSKLRESLTMQMEQSTMRTEVLMEENRKLQVELEKAQRALRELGNVGSGKSADTQLLRSVLGTDAYKLVELAQQLAMKERTMVSIHRQQRQARVKLSNSLSSSSDGK